MSINLFSLVIPVYKEEKIIEKNLLVVEEELKRLPYDYEIIVVVDGNKDNTFEIVRKISRNNKKVTVFGDDKNNGKGYAVKYGFSKASGDVIGFMDAGLDLDPSGIKILLDYMILHDADIVIGSKTHPDSVVSYPYYRKFISFIYRWINQFLFGFSVLDTQVGLKVFKKKVARDVFPRLLVKQYGFDVEILALSNVLGYTKIYEAPIKLKFRPGSISPKNFIKISFLMLWDSLAVFYRIRILQYYRKSNKENWLN
jgi:glycosyltransferase involved in cell wall biosynthesis